MGGAHGARGDDHEVAVLALVVAIDIDVDDSGHSVQCMIQWCPSRDFVVRRSTDYVSTAPESLTTFAPIDVDTVTVIVIASIINSCVVRASTITTIVILSLLLVVIVIVLIIILSVLSL